MENMVSPLGRKKEGRQICHLLVKGGKLVPVELHSREGERHSKKPSVVLQSRWAGLESTRVAFNTHKNTALAKTEFNHCLEQPGLPRKQHTAAHTPSPRDCGRGSGTQEVGAQSPAQVAGLQDEVPSHWTSSWLCHLVVTSTTGSLVLTD